MEPFIGINTVTVTQTVTDPDGDGVNEFTSTVTFTGPLTNLAKMTVDGSNLEGNALAFDGDIDHCRGRCRALAGNGRAGPSSSGWTGRSRRPPAAAGSAWTPRWPS